MGKIVPIQKEDYSHLASFLISHWKVEERYWLERFNFIWDHNPAFKEDPRRGFLVKNRDEILGFLGNFPIRFQLNSSNTVSSNGFSLLLAPVLRGTGLGKDLVFQHTETFKDKLGITTTPNKITFNIVKLRGYELIPRGLGDYNNYSLIPINKGKSLRLLINLSKLSNSMKAIKILGYNSLLFTSFKRKNRNSTTNNEYTTVIINKSSIDFNELWEDTKNEYSNTNIRDSEFIKWLLLPTLYADREIYATYENEKLCGFIVVRTTNFKGTRLMLCIDLWISGDNKTQLIQNLIGFSKVQAGIKACDALLLPHFSANLSATYHEIGIGYKAIGALRNDLFLKPLKSEVHLTENNSYISYINGDRFLSRETV